MSLQTEKSPRDRPQHDLPGEVRAQDVLRIHKQEGQMGTGYEASAWCPPRSGLAKQTSVLVDSCVADISRLFLPVLSMREGGEIREKQKRNKKSS